MRGSMPIIFIQLSIIFHDNHDIMITTFGNPPWNCCEFLNRVVPFTSLVGTNPLLSHKVPHSEEKIGKDDIE